jgi:hypothetical protein
LAAPRLSSERPAFYQGLSGRCTGMRGVVFFSVELRADAMIASNRRHLTLLPSLDKTLST